MRPENLYSFLESSFDYLLVVDAEERVVHAGGLPGRGEHLADLLTPQSLITFRSAIARSREGNRANAVFTGPGEHPVSIHLKSGRFETAQGEQFLFFGNRPDVFRKLQDWEKDERVKELAGLYAVAEWIKESGSVGEFFTGLPRFLAPAMLFPEEAIVHSSFQGVEYGRNPLSSSHISVPIIVGGRNQGEILVGYDDGSRELLHEEQRMLNEIGRMLSASLERKELQDEIARRTADLEEQNRKLALVNSCIDSVKGGWETSKSTIETMFKAIPDDVVLIDKHRKVVMTNRRDISPGTFCHESFFGHESPCEDCRLARILRDKTPVTVTMKHNDRFFQVQALPIYNDENAVEGIMEFYRDVTLEKTYEQQLQQADKLASLGQLVSGIGHEINNPNQFIRGNIKIVRQSLEDLLPIVEEYHASHPDLKVAKLNFDFWRKNIMTLVEDMDHGSQRIKEIVEGLRTFARKDEGLLIDTIDVNTLVEASARLVHNEVQKHAYICLDLDDRLPVFTGNAQKIEQVFVNLLVNAGQAMRDDVRGQITVRTRFEEPFLRIDIEDNGTGMNEKTQKQIFDPFFTTKRSKGGTGLGLAIVYRIVEEHGGVISVQSRPGAGTTFTIRIPAKTSAKGQG